jgi:hypothetical protein
MDIEIDTEAMHMVALAYRARRQAGDDDGRSIDTALATYRQLYPDHSPDEAEHTVRHILSRLPNTAGGGLPGRA